MKEVIIVSIVIKISKTWGALLHFRGVCSGREIVNIWVKNPDDFALEMDQEYILHLRVEGYCKEKKCLFTKILRSKKIL